MFRVATLIFFFPVTFAPYASHDSFRREIALVIQKLINLGRNGLERLELQAYQVNVFVH